MVRPSKYGHIVYGNWRYGVLNNNWAEISEVAPKGYGVEVTRRKLNLSVNRDSTTGWKTKSYTESTIVGVWVPRGGTPSTHIPGLYVQYSAAFVTVDPVKTRDQIKYGGEFYVVKTMEQIYDDTGSFAYRICQLHKLPLYKLG